MSNWSLVLTKTQQQELARENLERHGFRTFLPMFKTSKLRRGKRVEIAEELFRRHVLVEKRTQPLRRQRAKRSS